MSMNPFMPEGRKKVRRAIRRSIRAIFNRIQGMNNAIHPKDLPPYVPTKVINIESTQRYGVGRKRPRYADILTSGITTLKSMYEFINKNDDRLLVVQDGTAIKESVYSGGYGAVGAIANDNRNNTSGDSPLVDQMYPVEWNKELRSGAGLSGAANIPYIYQYIAAKTWFNSNYSISAGKYLHNQYAIWPSHITPGGIYAPCRPAYTVGSNSGAGKAQGTFIVFGVPIYDGKQRGIPKVLNVVKAEGTNEYSLIGFLTLRFDDTDYGMAKFYRITAVDIFIAYTTDIVDKETPDTVALFSQLPLFSKIGIIEQQEDFLKYPAHFLERIDMNNDGKEILTKTATFEDTSGTDTVAPTYIEFDDDFAEWETFNMQGWYAEITGGTVDETLLLGTRSVNSTKVRYAVTSAEITNDGDAVTVKVFPRWHEGITDVYYYPFVYDNLYKNLGSELYAYANIPTGDTGIEIFRYKFSCIANGRYFIFGTPDGFGYFSVKDSFDVIPSQNLLRPKKTPTGCIGINRDVFLYYKDSATRFTVLGNTQADQDDEFNDIGLVSQKAIVKINDDQVALMSYKGPYIQTGRTFQFIGDSLLTWWQKTGSLPYLTEAQIAECRVVYNFKRDQIWFAFPSYTDSDFTTGINFVFDLRAYKRGLEAWWILDTGTYIYNSCIADDNHLLTGESTSTPKIVDWNNDTPTESCATLIKLKLMQNTRKHTRLKNHFKAVFIKATTNDAIVTKVYFDGSASAVTITLNSDLQSSINYIKETMELEVSTASSTNDVEVESMEVTFISKTR